jgi:hypothetical protein
LLVGALAYSLINALWGVVAERWWRSHERPRKRVGEEA